jgi:hypothetical protein
MSYVDACVVERSVRCGSRVRAHVRIRSLTLDEEPVKFRWRRNPAPVFRGTGPTLNRGYGTARNESPDRKTPNFSANEFFSVRRV